MKWPMRTGPAAALVMHPPVWNIPAYPSTAKERRSSALERSTGVPRGGACGFSGAEPSSAPPPAVSLAGGGGVALPSGGAPAGCWVS